MTLTPTGYAALGYSDSLTPITLTVTGTVSAPSSGLVFNLTTGPDTFVVPGGSDNLVIATGNTLSTGDDIDPGSGGGNTLVLQGPGIFKMTLPATLTDINDVTAQEGQSSYVGSSGSFVSQVQSVYLRSGLDAAINVAPATINPKNPTAATITIFGAAGDDSTINLATGNDTVTLGSTEETVNGGGGNNTFDVTAATIGATINGGSGTNALDVSGGGTMAMGLNITRIRAVILAAAPSASPYNFAVNGLTGLEVADLSSATADTLIAGARGQIFLGGGAGKLTMNFNDVTNATLEDPAAALKGDTIENLANAPGFDFIDITNLTFNASTTTANVVASGGNVLLTVATGSTSTELNLAGCSPSSFQIDSLGADSTGHGTLVKLQLV